MIIYNKHSGYRSGIRLYPSSGGGGGGTTVESIPAWARPYMENVGRQAEDLYGKGDLGKVAGTSALQQAAFGPGGTAIGTTGAQGLDYLADQQSRLNTMAMAPSEATLAGQKNAVLLDAQKDIGKLTTGFGQTGTLGSARQAVMQGSQNADTTAKLADVNAKYEDAMFKNRLSAEGALGQSVGGSSALAGQTASGLANLGNQERGINQQQLDAPWQGLQRYASTIYGNPARSSVTQGGGK
jgi:hypothetical protein